MIRTSAGESVAEVSVMTAAREAAGRVDALRMRVARRRRTCALVHIYNRHHTHIRPAKYSLRIITEAITPASEHHTLAR